MQGPALAPTWAAPASSRTWFHGGGQPIVRRAVALMMETARYIWLAEPDHKKKKEERLKKRCSFFIMKSARVEQLTFVLARVVRLTAFYYFPSRSPTRAQARRPRPPARSCRRLRVWRSRRSSSAAVPRPAAARSTPAPTPAPPRAPPRRAAYCRRQPSKSAAPVPRPARRAKAPT